MDEDTYIGHVANLASGQYHAERVPAGELDWMLYAATGAAHWADKVKRGLFYGTEIELQTNSPPTSVQHDPALAPLVHAIIGLFTEAGELMEHLLAVLAGKASLDSLNLLEEAGDAHWYLALLHKFTNTTPSQAWEANIAKLRVRYPDRFTEDAARPENRDLEAERQALEAHHG